MTGLDFVTATYTKGGIEESRLSFFDAPVDMELFASISESSVIDYNRAKREVVIKISEVNAMVSEARLELLAEVFPKRSLELDDYIDSSEEEEQPRLEILARLMVNSFDINLSRLRFSLVTDEMGKVGHSILTKGEQVEDFVTSFLQTVSKLDLSWPHEEALSSAMQICIDRLTGVGFPLDEAWQCANTALLNFLEDVTGVDDSENEEDALAGLISGSVVRTISLFQSCVDESGAIGPLVENHLVVDFPEGISVLAVDLFYDHFVAVVFNSLFVTNGEGIHLLRLMPEVEQTDNSAKPDLDARSDAAPSLSSSTSTEKSSEGNPAFVCRWFKVNERYSFGRGGLPLSVLGGEIEEVTDVQEETMIDLEMGETELLFSGEVFDDVLYEASRILDPLKALLERPESQSARRDMPRRESLTNDPFHILATSAVSSLLFTNEDMVPFTRLILGTCVVSSETKRGSSLTSTELSARQLSLLYLAPYGELYPEQICVPEMSLGPPFTIRLDSTEVGESSCRLEFRGVRFFIVYQYVAECLQYFKSGTVGFGLWMANSSEALSKFYSSNDKKTSTSVEILFFDCSVIMPRSSLSSDMVALEVEKVRVWFEQLSSSFKMPTEDLPLNVAPLGGEEKASSPVSDELVTQERGSDRQEDSLKSGSTEARGSVVARTNIELNRFRAYTSMEEPEAPRSGNVYGTRESLAFNCFFEIDGQAEENKRVYRQVSPPQNYEIEMEKADRCWREVTSDLATLKVIVDYAPHLRIFISDEIEGNRTPFGLDVTLSQFCLLMSCWFHNMSELPVMFPVSASDLEVGSKYVANAATFPEFGTEEFRKIIASSYPATSEFAMSLSSISLRCTTDRPFETVSTEAKGILLRLDDATLEVINDRLGVTKVGLGALGAHLMDDGKTRRQVVHVENRKRVVHSWADLTFGTSEKCNDLMDELPLPFQMSAYLAPKATLYNLGMDSAILTLSDFSTLFGFIGFVSVYFCEIDLGNPSLRAEECLEEIKKGMSTGERSVDDMESDFLTDFRLWLSRPMMWVPILS